MQKSQKNGDSFSIPWTPPMGAPRCRRPILARVLRNPLSRPPPPPPRLRRGWQTLPVKPLATPPGLSPAPKSHQDGGTRVKVPDPFWPRLAPQQHQRVPTGSVVTHATRRRLWGTLETYWPGRPLEGQLIFCPPFLRQLVRRGPQVWGVHAKHYPPGTLGRGCGNRPPGPVAWPHSIEARVICSRLSGLGDRTEPLIAGKTAPALFFGSLVRGHVGVYIASNNGFAEPSPAPPGGFGPPTLAKTRRHDRRALFLRIRNAVLIAVSPADRKSSRGRPDGTVHSNLPPALLESIFSILGPGSRAL